MSDLDMTNCPDSANITISVEGTVSVQADVNKELMSDLDMTNCSGSANITISVEGTVSVQADVNLTSILPTVLAQLTLPLVLREW